MDREAKTYKIRLWGVVQGVGFRPFVAKLATRMKIKGEVRNAGGLVEIMLTDSPLRVEKWIEAIKKEKPEPAEIIHIRTEEIPYRTFQDFQISDSGEDAGQIVMFPPDLAVCPACAAEVENPADPRYGHPFISCMVCGPRYTIINKLPYDRENTTMDPFAMCPLCKKQYTDQQERRYHAQTISCHDCGPVLMMREKEGLPLSPGSDQTQNSEGPIDGRQQNAISLQNAVRRLKRGEIIALKGIGGYYLVCRAQNTEAVQNLRLLKHREEKPFAVMFGNLEQIKADCLVSDTEINLLTSAARPIVLLKRRPSCQVSPQVYKSSGYLGAFLPSLALQTMLIDQTGSLVMTSANQTERPIIKDDDEMFAMLKEPLLKAVFYHEREIRIRLDDSVVRVVDGTPQITRRSKGYVPSPVRIGGEGGPAMLLATGGQLKAAFCLIKGPFAYMSQYFGDLEDSDSTRIYEKNVERMQNLFGIKPQAVACDLHPGYFTTEYAVRSGLPVLRTQHHHAHTASVMAEAGLVGPVIGVAFDGTGYGTDGSIWGGEFLICEKGNFERAAHLNDVSILGGDVSMKQAWKSAMCHLIAAENGRDAAKPMHRYQEETRYDSVRKALAAGINKINTSSMGRLFDAVAALCGLQEENRYEGECAIKLESAAAVALEDKIPPLPMTFDINRSVYIEEERATVGQKESQPWLIDAAPVIRAAATGGAEEGAAEDRAGVALGFHMAVAEMILDICQKIRAERKISQVVLSGGVFQNKILMEESLRLLRREGFDVYGNTLVPPGDGGIALGQAYIARHRLSREGD